MAKRKLTKKSKRPIELYKYKRKNKCVELDLVIESISNI